jgi:hypothetical protein
MLAIGESYEQAGVHSEVRRRRCGEALEAIAAPSMSLLLDPRGGRMTADELADLEEQVEEGLFRDYVKTGEALRAIARGKGYRHHGYTTFNAYLREHVGIARQTASDWVRAAEVAADLTARAVTVRLDMRHAVLLYQLPPEVRCELAPLIADLPIRKAAAIVTEVWQQIYGGVRFKKPRHNQRYVRQAWALAREVAGLNLEGILELLAAGLDGLDDDERRQLKRDATKAAEKLSAIAEALGDPTAAYDC